MVSCMMMIMHACMALHGMVFWLHSLMHACPAHAGTATVTGKLLLAAFFMLSLPVSPELLHLAFTDIGSDGGRKE